MCTQPSWTCIERNVFLICGSVHEKSWGQCGYDSHIIFQTCLEMLHIKNVPKLTAIKQRSETALRKIINSWAASLHQASIAKQHWRRSSIHEQLAFIKQAKQNHINEDHQFMSFIKQASKQHITHLSSSQIWLICIKGRTKLAPKMRAMTTASTIWFFCWFKPPFTTTITYFSLCATICSLSCLYSSLNWMQGLNPCPSGCCQNSCSSLVRLELTACTASAGSGKLEITACILTSRMGKDRRREELQEEEEEESLNSVVSDDGFHVRRNSLNILMQAKRVKRVSQQLVMWALLPNLMELLFLGDDMRSQALIAAALPGKAWNCSCCCIIQGSNDGQQPHSCLCGLIPAAFPI